MENAADALKIAFAVFVFVVAITIAFSLISEAKSTADYVLYYGDETNFYENLNSREKNREVSISDVISTLYRYYKESLCVIVNLGSEEETYKFDLSLSKTELEKFKQAGIITELQTPSTEKDVEEMLKKFIANKLLQLEDAKFTEEFVEIPISGIYQTGEDETEIILSSGGKKVYITYTLQ